MGKKPCTELQSELNRKATEVLLANEQIFLIGACRIFVLWANSCVLCHLQSERDEEGEIVSWVSSPRYLPYPEMLKAFSNLKEWSECEQSSLDSIDCVFWAFSSEPAEPISKSAATASLNDIQLDVFWDEPLVLFFEALLQSLLMVNGWDRKMISAWCDSEDDAPTYDGLFDKLANITPLQAVELSKTADLTGLRPTSPPFCRQHGWMPPMIFG